MELWSITISLIANSQYGILPPNLYYFYSDPNLIVISPAKLHPRMMICGLFMCC